MSTRWMPMELPNNVEHQPAHDDAAARQGRLARQAWLAQHAPAEAGTLPSDSRVSPDLLGEVTACFVDGRFLAVAVLGLHALEQRLAELFFAAGRHELVRAGLALQIQAACSAGWITGEQQSHLERVRRIHYVATRLREPEPEQPTRRRMVIPTTIPANLLEENATALLQTLLQLNSRAPA